MVRSSAFGTRYNRTPRRRRILIPKLTASSASNGSSADAPSPASQPRSSFAALMRKNWPSVPRALRTPATRLRKTPPRWTSLGPAPLASDASGVGQQDYNWVSGRATAVAIDPADPTANTVYLGGAYGGVWKSTNAATQSPGNVAWTPLIDDQATLAVGAIAIQPGGNRSVIVVGTGEANSSTDSYYGLGILRSPDAGQTWTLIPSDITGTRSFAGMAFSKITFSTRESSVWPLPQPQAHPKESSRASPIP